MTRLRVLALLLIASVACHRSSRSPSLPPQPGIDRSPHLSYATSCAALETAIEDALVLRMRAQLEQIREGWGGWVLPAAGDANPAGPASFTTGNVQVAGVDEADFVQNDGTRIVTLAGGRLHLVSSWPADAMVEQASLAIEGWPRELFLAGDQVVVFSTIYLPREIEGEHPICAGPVMASLAADSAMCGYRASNVTKVTAVDVSTLSAPRVEAELYLPGSYLAARRMGARVRLVLTDELPFPAGVSFWPYGTSPGASEADRDRAFAELAAANEALIRARSLDDWLRRGTVKLPDGSAQELAHACTDFAVGSAPVLPGIVTIATLDLERRALASQTSVLARADVVYASPDTLYAAAGHWWWWPEPGQSDATYLHAFDLRDPDRAAYLGSGVVDGALDDPYQLDEHDGALRVASTLTSRVASTEPWGRVELSNQLTVLALAEGSLRTIGASGPFGKDERLFGTRFMGPRGFAITAKQVDPLFTFDLSDAARPRVVGELELPGFIAYLHPIDDTHLLGVGREPSPGGPMQVKIQLLDVSDLAAPSAVSTVLVGEGWSWSDALWDPHAFTWLPAVGLAAGGLVAIPFVDYGTDALVSDLRLFRVDLAQGISEAGRLSLADLYASGPGFGFAWSPYVRRSVLADEFVYAISDAGIRSARISDLPASLRTVAFEPLTSW